MDTKGKVISVLKKLGLMPFEDDDELEVMKVMNEPLHCQGVGPL
jgi:hypothetical protein